MAVLRKILISWVALFIAVASVPRCATLVVIYEGISSWFVGDAAGAATMSCHEVNDDHKPQSQDQIHSFAAADASCRCLLDGFLKVRLVSVNPVVRFQPMALVQSLVVNRYQSNLHLEVFPSGVTRPPIV